MLRGKVRAAGPAIVLAVAILVLASCGSGGGGDSTVARKPRVAAETAGHLAKLSDRVASDLDAGDTCNAAHAADELRAAVDDAGLPASMRPSVDAAAGRLVDQVNCPPPPAPPPTEDQKKQQERKGKHQDNHGGDHGSKPTGNGDKLPPGQAKLKGGSE